MFGYRIPSANQALIISGGKTRGDGPPLKVMIGRGMFVLPLVRRAQYLDLSMNEAEVEEECYTSQGLAVEVKAVCAFKVAPDPDSIVNAAQRFLTDQSQMSALAGRIFAGHLRSIVGSMTVEDIIKERQTLATQILEASETEMLHLGLLVDSFQIESINDGDSGYITAMAAPHLATITQQAAVAQAEADRASAEARQNSERQQSNYAKETEILKAQNKALVDQQTAEAGQAGPLAQAKAEQDVLDEQTQVAKRNAILTEQQLLATVVKPAEAQKQATIAQAEADSSATKLAAEATAANDRVSLDQLRIQQLPQIIQAAASGLAGSNLTILNGAEGFGEMLTRLVGEGQAIYDTLKAVRQTESKQAQAHNGGVDVLQPQ